MEGPQVFSGFDSPMVQAMVEGQPVHREFLEGKITHDEYKRRVAEIIKKHLGKSEPVANEDFAAWR